MEREEIVEIIEDTTEEEIIEIIEEITEEETPEIDYTVFPKNLKELGRQIKIACSKYWKREVTEEQFKEILYDWCENTGLLEANDINATVKRVIGKKRIELIKIITRDYVPTPKEEIENELESNLEEIESEA